MSARLKRRLSTVALGVSLALCLMTAAAWLLSYRKSASLRYGRGNREYAIVVNEDQVGLAVHVDPSDIPARPGWRFARTGFPLSVPPDHGLLGFGYERQAYDEAQAADRRYVIPLWFPFILFAAAPVMWVRQRRKTVAMRSPRI